MTSTSGTDWIPKGVRAMRRPKFVQIVGGDTRLQLLRNDEGRPVYGVRSGLWEVGFIERQGRIYLDVCDKSILAVLLDGQEVVAISKETFEGDN